MAQSGWGSLSLVEQMGNIGSEVGRAARWQGKHETRFWGAVERGLDLFDRTLEDKRWDLPRRQEIARAREMFAGAALEGKYCGTALKELEEYFMAFARAARER